ncbi:hypothetical protein, partial [Pseudomonas sp. DrBHI1]|uniref:hypothetical protein n=1 Tax=Pseudomonas sp. DrBHI1 TaxID=2006091 RepID=UPI00211417A7
MAARLAASFAESLESVESKLLIFVLVVLIDSHWNSALACENAIPPCPRIRAIVDTALVLYAAASIDLDLIFA